MLRAYAAGRSSHRYSHSHSQPLCIQFIFGLYPGIAFLGGYGFILPKSFWGKGFADKMSFCGSRFGGAGLLLRVVRATNNKRMQRQA